MADKNQERQFTAVSTDDVRELIRQMGLFSMQVGALLQAVGDGRVPLDGSKANGTATTRVESHPERKPTVKELRALGAPARFALTAPARPVAKPRPSRGRMPSRVAVELITDGGRIDQDGLTNAARTIIRYLVVHHQSTIRDLADETKLKRSTIMNALTELRQRGIVQSVKIDGVTS